MNVWKEDILICANQCKAKVYAKMTNALKDFGSPDLIVLFTSTMSHKMLRSVMNEAKKQDLNIARCSRSSISALKDILAQHTKGA